MNKDLEAILIAVGGVVLCFSPGIAAAIWFIATH